MEGMANRGGPAELGFHSFLSADEMGTITSVHQVPDEAFTHTCDPDGHCLCGPQVVFNIFHGQTMPMFRHAPLDIAYYQPADDDYDAGSWGLEAHEDGITIELVDDPDDEVDSP